MSVDLETRQSKLPVIRLHKIEVPTREFSTTTGAADKFEYSNGDDECVTPTSIEQKIPELQSCPPAPKKLRTAVLCKRKLSEFQFFEVTEGGREQVDSFFSTSFFDRIVSRKINKGLDELRVNQ